MIDLSFALPTDRPPRFLFIGAHCDDIEIGCGGTVIELFRRYPEAQVKWVVLSAVGARAKEARMAAKAFSGGRATGDSLQLESFRESYFPSQLPQIKDSFETFKPFQPDVIFAHCRDELHQDHRIVGELVWNTFRNHLIFEYEIPKYDGGLGSPSAFMPLAPRTIKRKLDLLMKHFPSQHARAWFTPETFSGLSRIRGIECNATSGYAEAFYCRKLVLANGT